MYVQVVFTDNTLYIIHAWLMKYNNKYPWMMNILYICILDRNHFFFKNKSVNLKKNQIYEIYNVKFWKNINYKFFIKYKLTISSQYYILQH